MKTIYKSAAIIIKNGLLLMVRKRNTEIFISPGGKPNPGENHEDCLRRELKEELSLDISEMQHFGIFKGISQFEDQQIIIETSIVQTIGTPCPGNEIEAIAWINPNFEKYNLHIGSIFSKHVVPALVKNKLLYEKPEIPDSNQKTFVFNLDGTLTFGEEVITKELQSALYEILNARHRLVFVTSHPYHKACLLLGGLADTSEVITCNGSHVYKKGTPCPLQLNHHSKDITAITPIDTNKYSSLYPSTAPQERIYAFGNDESDFHLLTSAHQGIVVGNQLYGVDTLPHISRITSSSSAVATSIMNCIKL